MNQLRHDIGDVIKERYTIREVLGGGAFGTVYRVEETIGARIVTLACKEMHVMSDPDTTADERQDALRMFQEEAYLLQTLRNPHIPAAYFESAKGVWLACQICGRTFRGTRACPEHGAQLEVVKERFYLIMDFIEGPDLEERLLQNGGRPLDETSVLEWALQVCDALEAVHNKGLSHRDIKPANIKLYKDTNQAMLIDFGLVKPSNAVGAYGTVLKRSSTGAGTLGYAPESQHEQMHPDARTDILALGMTLYRLLTCLDPTEPDDLVLMRRGVPSGSNLSISPLTDAIITRAIQSDPEKRYPNVVELRKDLRAARYPVETPCEWCGHVQFSAARPDADTLCERCGRTLLSHGTARTSSRPRAAQPSSPPQKQVAGTTLSSRNSPFQKRINDIRAELSKPPNTPPHPLDARIAELEAQLAASTRQIAANSNQCPGCQRAELTQIGGQPTGRCPLCDKSRLLRRQWDDALCPVCRTGKLHDHELQGDRMFCPVCRTAPLEEEHRKQFVGLLVDDWAVCHHCEARFDIMNGSRASLESYRDDPFGMGALHGKETLTITEWRKLSQRPNKYCNCDNCSALFAITDDDRRVLVRHDIDPHGVAAQYKAQPLSRDDWAKIANGMSFSMGNLHCPNCHAEWDFDRHHQTLNLLSAPNVPAWAEPLRVKPHSLANWSAAAAGKTSARPGPLCPNCKTEFDNEGNVLKLISTPSATLAGMTGQMHSLQDWQRRAQNLPAATEVQEMRNELSRLQTQRHNERQHSMRTQASLRSALEAELLDLLKKSVMKGHIPLKRMSGQAGGSAGNGTQININDSGMRVALRANEALRWESPARLCSVRVVNNRSEWRQEAQGTLVVTSERVLFSTHHDDAPLFQRPLPGLRTVEIDRVEGVAVVVMTFAGMSDIAGFIVGDVRWDITLDGKNYALTFTPQELVEIILQQQLAP